ncbi:hypothetical protein CIB87_21315 [Priestia megaterium]|uniref:Uncharacterized protein n=1 Tax=Priestia megaterium TaxID=1404 RepID=A0AA86LVB0_PRIMG|nr:hypothetical protein [Priestia megaterium]AXI31455.1 hypothetical protein CIB87_21315 [Priestia megaterium]
MTKTENVMNRWYTSILGVNVDYDKLNWNEQQRLDRLVERQLELDGIKAKEAFSNMSPNEQRKRSLEARMFELAFEPTRGKELRDVDNATLEKVLRDLKKLVKQ